MNIFDKIFRSEQKIESDDVTLSDSENRRVILATCALLLEMAQFDGEFSESEQARFLEIMESEYGLSGREAEEIQQAAQRELAQARDLWQFTHRINQQFTPIEKERVIELVWRMVYADGKLDKHEDYLVHKLARLLNLSHSQLIDAKLRVLYDE
ncbi:MAG: hypothetical protein Kow0042_16040 [Calditrichia bacterium]